MAISRYFGSNPDYIIGGGGNTSFKNDRYLWVKASGVSLADITLGGFVQLYRDKLGLIGKKKYSEEVQKREAEVKEDMLAARVHPEKGQRPSVETALHNLLEYPFVVHTHPALVNGLMCSVQAKEKTRELFGEEALFVGFGAGYSLFVQVKEKLSYYRNRFGKDPQMIFMRNHGIFVGANTIDEIVFLYGKVTAILEKIISPAREKPLSLPKDTELLLEGMTSILKGKKVKVRHSTLHRHFYQGTVAFSQIARPYTPDIVVYCGPAFIYSEKKNSRDILEDTKRKTELFRKKYGSDPRIILVKGHGLFGAGDTESQTETLLDVFEDFMKISKYSEAFGGPHPLSEEEIAFVNNWEAESYRRRLIGEG